MYLSKLKQFQMRIQKAVLSEKRFLKAEFARSEDPVPFKDRKSLTYSDISEGGKWGETWDSAWFRLTATVPAEWRGRKAAALLDFNGEGLIFSNEGVPLQGITNMSVFAHRFVRDTFIVLEKCKGCEKIELWVETAANGIFGIGNILNDINDPDINLEEDGPRRYGYHEGTLNKCRLAIFDEEMFQFSNDFNVLLDLAESLPEAAVKRAKILRCLNEASNAFKENPANAPLCRDILKRELSKPAEASALAAIAVGHAHIDTGWLWPVKETIRKCGRTFSNQIALIEKYPSYVFGASQPQHYEFTQKHYPELYKKIKKYVKSGQWELQGGMWVEADCNIISGESMVRQFLYGKNFYMDEFGIDVKNLWLPDVFGYSAAMPQIIKKSGCDFFLTQKISWNKFNKFPYNTFIWRGVDGSGVVSHFPPENTYNSWLQPSGMRSASENFAEKAFLDEFLVLFGVGDGGGGPREDYIESGLRQADLEGAPKVKFAKSELFFDNLAKRSGELPTWSGELYLEAHRGTLTTQARVKKFNRKIERKLREVEYLYSSLAPENYPAEKLDDMWKLLLINQFHDIIPGSSINKVYKTTHAEHDKIYADALELLGNVAEKLFVKKDKHLTVFNSISYPFSGALELPESWGACDVSDANGKSLPTQIESGKTVVMLENIPPASFVTLKKTGDLKKLRKVNADEALVLENAFARYEFNQAGELLSGYDKLSGRAILDEGEKGNVLSLYEDRPLEYDAWDVDLYYEEQLLENASSVSVERIADGPVRQGIRFELVIGKSRITQDVYLDNSSARLDFNCKALWLENHHMLRTAFPISIHTDAASFDIQYGFVRRSTHRNTSWELAKFETAAHRYIDISSQGRGVALINDCKYGHKVHDNVLDLNLLRSPKYPDPDADMGEHTFTYSLFPHKGTLSDSDVMAHAEMINQPPLLFDGFSSGKASLPVAVSGDGVSMEVLKKAQKEDCLVLRIVETKGRESECCIKLKDSKATLCETNLMEWTDGGKITVQSGAALFNLKPFEIKTIKIKS